MACEWLGGRLGLQVYSDDPGKTSEAGPLLPSLLPPSAGLWNYSWRRGSICGPEGSSNTARAGSSGRTTGALVSAGTGGLNLERWEGTDLVALAEYRD